MAIMTFQRYERKFYISRDQYRRLLPVINEHMEADPYCPGGQSYNLVNLYFDDDHNTVISNSVLKPKFKEKLRLRCYGPPENDDTVVYFEIKSKFYGIVAKRRVGMTFGEAKEYIRNGTHPETDLYINRQVLDEIDALRQRLPCKPRLIISYDRSAYFMRGDSSIRLTFDKNIMTDRECTDVSMYKGGDLLIPENNMILEIKLPDSMPLWLSKALSEEGIFMTSFSKYGFEFEHRSRESR